MAVCAQHVRSREQAVRIKLEDAVTEARTVEVEIKPALYADVCDGCGRIFRMREFCGERGRAELRGTFDKRATDPETGKGLGNTYHARVCSFKCAHTLFAEGGWRRDPRYGPFAAVDVRLARAELCVTAGVDDEAAIRREWSGG